MKYVYSGIRANVIYIYTQNLGINDEQPGIAHSSKYVQHIQASKQLGIVST